MLNIYIPRDLSLNSTSGLLPVFTWVHGGGWVLESANEYGEVLALIGDMIVVTSNIAS